MKIILTLLMACVMAFGDIDEPDTWENRQKCRYFYLGERRGLIVDRYGLKMYVDPRDIGVVAHLISSCNWEINETRLVRSLLKGGQKWIEVGANFGYYTIMIGDFLRQTSGKLFAFEGSPRFMKYLKDSSSVNGLDGNIDWFQNAVYKTSGETIMFQEYTEFAGGSHIQYEVEKTMDFSKSDDTIVHYPVTTITIDDAMANVTGGLDFLKMDAEGSECNILAGSNGVLDRSPNIKIIMEWNLQMQGHAGSKPRECLQNLADRGFHFSIIRTNGVHRTTIDYLTNNDQHLDIFLRKPLMPTEDLGLDVIRSDSHVKSEL